MDKTIGTKVSFSSDNVAKCMCPECPVQVKSMCSSDKLAKIKGSLAKTPLIREEIPGLYCSTGSAICTDLDFERACSCGNCPVFSECSLIAGAPVGYYCRDGFAN